MFGYPRRLGCCCPVSEFIYIVGNNSVGAPATVTRTQKSDGNQNGTLSLGTGASGIAVDSDGNIHVVYSPSTGAMRLAKYDADLVQLGDVEVTSLQRSGTVHCCLDGSGNIYIGGQKVGSTLRLWKYNSSLTHQWDVESVTRRPWALSNGTVVVGSPGSGLEVRDSSGSLLRNLTGGEGSFDANADIYVNDSGPKIHKYAAGSTSPTWTYSGSGGAFTRPVHSTGGFVYFGHNVVESGGAYFDGSLVKITDGGTFVDSVSFASGVGSSAVVAVVTDNNGDVFVIRGGGLASASWAGGRYDADLTEIWSGGNFNQLFDLDCDPGRHPVFF